MSAGRHLVHKHLAAAYAERMAGKGQGAAGRRPAHPTGGARSDHHRQAGRNASPHRAGVGPDGRPAARRRQPTACSTPPRVLDDVTPTCRCSARRSSARWSPSPASAPTPKPSRWPTTANTACRGRPHARHRARHGNRPTTPRRPGACQRPDRQRRRHHAHGWAGRLGQRLAPRRPGQLGRVHPVAVDHGAQHRATLPLVNPPSINPTLTPLTERFMSHRNFVSQSAAQTPLPPPWRPDPGHGTGLGPGQARRQGPGRLPAGHRHRHAGAGVCRGPGQQPERDHRGREQDRRRRAAGRAGLEGRHSRRATVSCSPSTTRW